MSLSILAAQAQIIVLGLESRLMQDEYIYFDFKKINKRVKRAVIKAFLTPLYEIHQEEGYKKGDHVRFSKVKETPEAIFRRQRAEHIKEVDEKYRIREEEREARDKEKYFSLT